MRENTRLAGTVTVLLLLGLSSSTNAEYLIYLKGGHFIVADNCSFSTNQGLGILPETDVGSISFEECTREMKPKEGRIYWRTIDGDSGEVNADDVYDILGTQSFPTIKSAVSPMPLEDYLITNRGESFVNAKMIEEKDIEVHGLKRDELAKLNRRGVIEIAPESLVRSRSGEGLCPGESIDFAVSNVEMVEGHLVGVITNLSKEPWLPAIEVEVRVRGRFLGKFEVGDRNILNPDETASLDSAAPSRFLKELEQLKDDEAGVRVCYRKVKTVTKGPIAEKSSTP